MDEKKECIKEIQNKIDAKNGEEGKKRPGCMETVRIERVEGD